MVASPAPTGLPRRHAPSPGSCRVVLVHDRRPGPAVRPSDSVRSGPRRRPRRSGLRCLLVTTSRHGSDRAASATASVRTPAPGRARRSPRVLSRPTPRSPMEM